MLFPLLFFILRLLFTKSSPLIIFVSCFSEKNCSQLSVVIRRGPGTEGRRRVPRVRFPRHKLLHERELSKPRSALELFECFSSSQLAFPCHPRPPAPTHDSQGSANFCWRRQSPTIYNPLSYQRLMITQFISSSILWKPISDMKDCRDFPFVSVIESQTRLLL